MENIPHIHRRKAKFLPLLQKEFIFQKMLIGTGSKSLQPCNASHQIAPAERQRKLLRKPLLLISGKSAPHQPPGFFRRLLPLLHHLQHLHKLLFPLPVQSPRNRLPQSVRHIIIAVLPGLQPLKYSLFLRRLHNQIRIQFFHRLHQISRTQRLSVLITARPCHIQLFGGLCHIHIQI